MSIDINIVTITGKVIDAPIISRKSNYVRANFTIESIKKYTSKTSGPVTHTLFLDVSAFGKTAEICEKLINANDLVLLEGSLQYYAWETKDGNPRDKLSLLAEKIIKLPQAKKDPSLNFEEFLRREN